MKRFDELSHLGKRHRLRPLARDVLRRFGIDDASLSQVKESINVVFRVRTLDGTRYVLRMTPPWHFHGPDDIHSEIAWLRAITSETDIGAPAPIAAPDGRFIISVRWPEVAGEWHCVLFGWLRGASLANRWTLANIERFGLLSARLHVHGSTFVPPHGFRIRTYDDVLPHCAPGFVHPEPRLLFDGLDDRLMPPERRELFRQVGERVQAEIDRLFATGSPQPVHNDLHPWNVMVAAGRMQALDFENCLLGFPVQDVGTTLHYVQQHFEKKLPFPASLVAFRRGYESERAWPEEHAGQVDTMTAGHRLLLCNFYVSHQDADFREFGVGFMARMETRFRDYLAGV